MSRPIEFPTGTAEEMQQLLKEAKTAAEVRRIQSVMLGAQGVSSLSIAPLVGFTPAYIRKVWKQYRKSRKSSLLGERRGGRHNAYLSWEEEEKFLEPFFATAKEAGILIVSGVQKVYEEKYRRKVQPSVMYYLLHRHGWRKVAPRPAHPKGDEQAQEEFRRSFPPEGRSGKAKSSRKRT